MYRHNGGGIFSFIPGLIGGVVGGVQGLLGGIVGGLTGGQPIQASVTIPTPALPPPSPPPPPPQEKGFKEYLPWIMAGFAAITLIFVATKR